MTKHALAVTAYNRPEHFSKVMSMVEKHHNGPLYIFIDGPKDAADNTFVQEVRWQAREFSEARIITFPYNRGLRRSIKEAVDTVLSENDTIILLEDDCLPGPYFFEYMYDCLNIYAKIDEVMGVSGYTIPIPEEIRKTFPWDIYFVPRAGSWGWGTWRRAWDHLIWDIPTVLKRLDEYDIDITQGGHDVLEYARQVVEEDRDLWTPAWILSIYLRYGLYAYPMVSHIRNIGWDGSGANCVCSQRYETNMATRPTASFPLKPIIASKTYDHFRTKYK